MKCFACIKNPRHAKATAKYIIKHGGRNVKVRFDGVRISFESNSEGIRKIQNIGNVKNLYVYSY